MQKNSFSLVTNDDLGAASSFVDDYAKYTKGLITFNGGFFDQNYHSLGLRITNKQKKNPLKLISWWGVFYIKNKQAFLSNASSFPKNSQIDFAIQAGPRLLINRKIPNLIPGKAERSALGITSDGKVIVVVTDNQPMTTTELANLLSSSLLNCQDALNLDGGSSSQLFVKLPALQLQVYGFSKVSDAIFIKPL